MTHFLLAILAILSLLAQGLVLGCLPFEKLTGAADVGIPKMVRGGVETANIPRGVPLKLRRLKWDAADFADPDQIVPRQEIRRTNAGFIC
ncbi:hypothetical protein T484DRAFT_1832522 [Baffinella frigidus]|nr:hypothetical protein T484DRAFT_1832522 [Cryptophyta sp. CCMP2293]